MHLRAHVLSPKGKRLSPESPPLGAINLLVQHIRRLQTTVAVLLSPLLTLRETMATPQGGEETQLQHSVGSDERVAMVGVRHAKHVAALMEFHRIHAWRERTNPYTSLRRRVNPHLQQNYRAALVNSIF